MFPQLHLPPFAIPVSTPKPQEEAPVTASEKFERLREQYATFVCNSHVSKAQAREDFNTLAALPGVEGIAFTVTKQEESGEELLEEMLIGTEYIHIQHSGTRVWHDIGQFIIYYRRVPSCSAIFKNIVHTIQSGDRHFPHPHIRGDGIMCIATGGHEINANMVAGRYVDVVRTHLELLNSVTTPGQIPPAELKYWPLM